jgi:hypothetical protein
MAEATLWFPLGRHYECVIEKRPSGWQLRVLERGATVLTHRIDEQLARRLLSARRNPAVEPITAVD